MFCKNCGSENLDSSKFCSKCGTELLKESNGGENAKEVLSNVNQADSDKKKVNFSKKNKMILAGVVGVLLIVSGIFLIYLVI